jgi:pimeloyl-ACP methyl ester carboxylesterase
MPRGKSTSGGAEPRLFLFFDRTEISQRASRGFIERQRRRTTERDPDSNGLIIAAQLQAIVRWGATGEATVRLQQISQPVLVVNGKSDVMVPTINSFALFDQLPNGGLSLYPTRVTAHCFNTAMHSCETDSNS